MQNYLERYEIVDIIRKSISNVCGFLVFENHKWVVDSDWIFVLFIALNDTLKVIISIKLMNCLFNIDVLQAGIGLELNINCTGNSWYVNEFLWHLPNVHRVSCVTISIIQEDKLVDALLVTDTHRSEDVTIAVCSKNQLAGSTEINLNHFINSLFKICFKMLTQACSCSYLRCFRYSDESCNTDCRKIVDFHPLQ